jgi:hypothetical protein
VPDCQDFQIFARHMKGILLYIKLLSHFCEIREIKLIRWKEVMKRLSLKIFLCVEMDSRFSRMLV